MSGLKTAAVRPAKERLAIYFSKVLQLCEPGTHSCRAARFCRPCGGRERDCWHHNGRFRLAGL